MMKAALYRWIILVAAVLGVGLVYWGIRSRSPETPKPQAVAIRVLKVQKQSVPIILREVGTVFPNHSVSVRPRLDSQVTTVNFKDGDFVKEGELLFELDSRALVAQLNAQKATLEKEKAQLVNLQAQYERSSTLNKKGFEAKSNYDVAKASYEAQKATVDSAQAAVENTQVQLDYTRIVAPLSGRAGTINTTVGNTVKTTDSAPLVTINQVNPIKVQVSLPQQYLDDVRLAMLKGPVPVTAHHDDFPKPFVGKLIYVDNNVDQSSGRFAARAVFENPKEELWPGMYVTLELELGIQKDVVVVPEHVLQHGQGGDFVFVIVQGKAQYQTIKVERLQGGVAVVSKGLVGGETVASDGFLSLKDGIEVDINPAMKAKAAP